MKSQQWDTKIPENFHSHTMPMWLRLPFLTLPFSESSKTKSTQMNNSIKVKKSELWQMDDDQPKTKHLQKYYIKKTTLHAVARGQHKDSNIVRPHTIHFSLIDTI